MARVTSTADRTVFVIDYDEAARASWVSLLRSEGLDVGAFAAPGALAQDMPPNARGCLVIDLSHDTREGLDLIASLKTAGSLLPVIVLSPRADVGTAIDALKAGASEVLEKPADSARLLRIVRSALEESEAAHDAAAAMTGVTRRMESLTTRERQVLDLIMKGASNKVVAQSLAISPRTVEIYRANVMSKMRAESFSDLIRMTLSAA